MLFSLNLLEKVSVCKPLPTSTLSNKYLSNTWCKATFSKHASNNKRKHVVFVLPPQQGFRSRLLSSNRRYAPFLFCSTQISPWAFLVTFVVEADAPFVFLRTDHFELISPGRFLITQCWQPICQSQNRQSRCCRADCSRTNFSKQIYHSTIFWED